MHENKIEDIYTGIGQRMAQYRNDQNLTQAELANKMNIRQQVIADYEIARSRMSIAFLFRLAEILCVDVLDLLGIDKGISTHNNLKKSIEMLMNAPAEKQNQIIAFIDKILKKKKNSK